MSNAKATARLRAIPMDLGCWLEIDERYERKRWGLRGIVVEPHVRREASTDPTKVGFLLSMLGVEGAWAKLDHQRGVARGETAAFLDRLTKRRNRIAHEGDRVGRGRAALTAEVVRQDIDDLESVVDAIHAITAKVVQMRSGQHGALPARSTHAWVESIGEHR